MIKALAGNHYEEEKLGSRTMPAAPLSLAHSVGRSDSMELDEPAQEQRLAALVAQHLDFVWRSLRRLGVPMGEVDDATQQFWIVLARKLSEMKPGSERAFFTQSSWRSMGMSQPEKR